MKKIFLLVLLLIFWTTSAQAWSLVWSDEFNTAGCTAASPCLPDATKWKWVPNEGYSGTVGHTGPTVRTRNARVEDGHLTLQSHYEGSWYGRAWSTPVLATQDTRPFGPYGRFEVRAKWGGPTNGYGASIWFLGQNYNEANWPDCGEIDLAEYAPGNWTGVGGMGHGFGCASPCTNSYITTTGVNPTSDYKVYAMEWYADHIDLYYDDVKVHTFTKSGSWPFDQQIFMILDMEAGGAFGTMSSTLTPVTWYVDYVRYYTAEGTADLLANPKTQALLTYLTSGLSGKILSGQIDAYMEDNPALIAAKSPYKWPAIMGIVSICTPCDGGTGDNVATMLSKAISHGNNGGIVLLQPFWDNPKTGAWGLPALTTTEMTQIITPGQALNTTWNGYLDLLAASIATLQSNNIPVILNPFTEMSNSGDRWYYVSAANAAYFKNLWIYTFNYLTVTKGLHNILFAYAPDHVSGTALTVRYPGDAYVDITGYSLYDLDRDGALEAADITDANTLIALGKPFGFTELGACHWDDWATPSLCPEKPHNPLIASIIANVPSAKFYATWFSVFGDNHATDLPTMYGTNTAVITRDEVAYFGAADSLANAKTQALLTYITGLSSKVLSGQEDGHPSFGDYARGRNDAVAAKSPNKYPAIMGLIYSPFPSAFTTENDKAIAHSTAGGIVLAQPFWDNPKTGTWGGSLTTAEMTQVVTETPPNTLNTAWKATLDSMATSLATLQTNNVSVIFNAFTEPENCGDRWYCMTNANAVYFKNLWIYTFNYLTTTKELHNLLWLYSTDNTYLYPGSAYVDLVGYSYYDENYDGTISSTGISRANAAIAAFGKPFGFSEMGVCNWDATATNCPPRPHMPMLTSIKNSIPATKFWFTWNSWWSMDHATDLPTLFGDSWVLTRDEVNYFGCTGASPTWTAASAALADVKACVAVASDGDTINIPATPPGGVTWTETVATRNNTANLYVTKGITLKGAGIGNTVITAGAETSMILYTPANFTANNRFRVTGIEFNLNNLATAIFLRHEPCSSGGTVFPMQTNIRIDHNKIYGKPAGRNAIRVLGMMGVIDNNIITSTAAGPSMIAFYNDCGDYGKSWWENWPGVIFGADQNTMYVEDNVLTISSNLTGAISSQYANRWSARYNDITTNIDEQGFLMEYHSSAGPNGMYGMFGGEIYGNKVTVLDVLHEVVVQRAGHALVHHNLANTGSSVRVYSDAWDCYNPISETFEQCAARPGPVGKIQHVNDSYYWGNRKTATGTLTNVNYWETFCSTGTSHTIICNLATHGYTGVENEGYWQHKVPFTGAAGVGCGTLATLQGAAYWTSCTPGVAYWATDQATCTDLTGYVGASTAVTGGTRDPAKVISGTLYKCNGTGNGWTPYATPLTYPHPLRAEVSAGSTSWGHSVSAAEPTKLAFAAAWTCSIPPCISGSGDEEKITLKNAGEYAYTTNCSYVGANKKITLKQSYYRAGDNVILKYRTAGDLTTCNTASWSTYSAPFWMPTNHTYIGVRVEK